MNRGSQGNSFGDFTHPDAMPDGIPREDLSGQDAYWGEKNFKINPQDNMAHSKQTLVSLYSGQRPRTTDVLVQTLIGGEGWFFKFAPLVRSPMNQSATTFAWETSMAQLTPEGGVPDLVQYKEREIHGKLLRMTLASEISMDALNQPRGKEIFAQSVKEVASGFWLAVKVNLSTKILGAKDIWMERAKNEGEPFKSILAATQHSREMFGAIERYPKGIYIVNTQARAELNMAQVEPNMVVLPAGTLDHIAQTPFETEAFRRGEKTAARRLALGGRSFTSEEFPGVEMFEDPRYIANNIRADQIQQFVCNTMTGEWFCIDKTSYDPHCDDSCASKQLSVQIPNLKTGTWDTISVADVVSKNLDQRFDPVTGELSDWHQNLIDNIDTLAKAMNVQDFGANIDPYIVFSAELKRQNGKGYYPARIFGEVNPSFLSTKTLETVADGIARATSREFTDDDYRNVVALETLATELSNPANMASDSSVKAFIAALSVSAGRRIEVGENPLYLESNSFGVPDLPDITVAANGSLLLRKDGRSFVLVVDANQDVALLESVADNEEQARLSIKRLPSRPYGYGSLPGLRYLASLYKNTGGTVYAPWEDIFEIAYKGVRAFERMAKIVRRVIPVSPLNDPNNLPDFLRSINGEYNKDTLLWIALVSETTSYPFLMRAFKVDARTLLVSSNKARGGVVVRKQVSLKDISNDHAAELLRSIKDTRTGDDIDAAVLQKSFSDLLMLDNIPNQIVKALTDPVEYNRLNKIFVAWSGDKFNNLYRVDFRTNFSKDAPVAGAELSTFLYTVQSLLVLDAIDINVSKVTLIRGILEAMTNNVRFVKTVSVEFLQSIAANPDPISSSAAPKSVFNAADASNWINTRLTLSRDTWIQLLKTKKLKDSIFQPANPSNPLKPLFQDYAPDSDDVVEQFASALNTRADPLVHQFSLFKRSWIKDDDETTSASRRRFEAGNGLSSLLADSLQDAVALQSTSSDMSLSTLGNQGESRKLILRSNLFVRLEELQRSAKNTQSRWFARALLFSRTHKDNVSALISTNVPPLFSSYIFLRPFIQQHMGSGLWARGGLETAETGYNYDMAELTGDAIHDLWTYKFVCYANPFLKNPRNWIVKKHISFKKYICGRDASFFTDPRSFRREGRIEEASLFAFCVGGELTAADIPDPLSLTGMLDVNDFPFNFDKRVELFRQGLLQIPILYYVNLWQFHKLNENRPSPDPYTFLSVANSKRRNVTTYRGDMKKYNTASKKHSDFHLGTSHWSGIPLPFNSVANGSMINNPMLTSTFIKD